VATDLKDKLALVQGNTIEREEFGARELMRQAERAAVAQAAQAKAEVEARYVMAMKQPRDIDQVRVELLKDCDRYAFAKASRYKIPNRGEGWTIRFAEAAVRHMRNIYIPASVIYDDEERRIIRVTATDVEINVSWPKDTTISKTIERYDSTGRDVVRVRTTTSGKLIYIVRATDEELAVKENSLVWKAARSNALRLVPPDILEECLAAVNETLQKNAKTDPEGERKAIADAFAALGVLPMNLKAYLGCELSQVQPADLVELRKLYTALREGNTSWREVMAEREVKPDANAPGGENLKAKLQKRAAKEKPAPIPTFDTWEAAEAFDGPALIVAGEKFEFDGEAGNYRKVTG